MTDTASTNVVPIDWSRRRTPPDWLGPLLRTARASHRWSLREVARLAGISREQMWKLEDGRRTPSVSVARALAAVLELTDEQTAELLAAAVPYAGRDWPGRAPRGARL
jgi:transcriptional regulator with XRE-family HTH domain